MADTIYRLETLSTNGVDYLPRYVGNAPADVLRYLRESLGTRFLRDVREVDAVPGDLLRPRGALELVALASAQGRMWDLSGRAGFPDAWVDLTVFATGEVAPLPALFTVSWCEGKVRANVADKCVTYAEAFRRLATLN